MNSVCESTASSSTISYFSKLKALCNDMNLSFSDSVLKKCLIHLNLVINMNKQFNLTRITNVSDALVLHIIDSLLFSQYVDQAPDGTLLDFGTGAGFPGIPLSIASQRECVLLDSVGKKIHAVESFIHTLDLDNVKALHIRVEDYALTNPASCSCIVARAVAELPVLIEYASPLLIHNGLFVVSKGNPSDDELLRGNKAASICGLSFLTSSDIDLPLDLGHRKLLVYRKINNSSIKLPRKAGTAKKDPLA